MMLAMAYPVSVTVEPQLTNRNKQTTALRLFLAIPHLLLVGGVGASFAVHQGRADNVTSAGGETGLLGSIAFVLAIASWFTILILDEHFTAIRRYSTFYLRWRVRALAYLMLLQDAYPPFGDAAYPAALVFEERAGPRNRASVMIRILAALPHFFVLFGIACVWWATTVVAWIAILVNGKYPAALYDFGVGALRYLVRVEAYMLLLTDEYPPFSLT